MNNVVITGSQGLLGGSLQTIFPKAIHLGHKDLDITDKKAVFKSIKKLNPDVVINTAAFTDVERAEEERNKAYSVNAEGPENLAKVCKKTGSLLMHFSTDYVFDGKKGTYQEEDSKNPVNVYGETKSAGEELIKKNLEKYYIIRTSWLFGSNGSNFVDKMKNIVTARNEIKVVDDQKSSPTYTEDLAQSIKELLNTRPSYGIYHRTNNGECSRYKLVKEVCKIINADCEIIPVSSDYFDTKATRPQSSVLISKKLEPLRHWKEALKEYLK